VTTRRLIAIVLIYLCATFAWFTLGTSVVARSGEFDGRLDRDVALLWGGRHVQIAPTVRVERPRLVTETVKVEDGGRSATREVTKTVVDREPLALDSSRVEVDLALDQRRKGLLWYDTYGVRVRATYRVRNPDEVERTLVTHFAFPSAEALYDGFAFAVDGEGGDPAGELSKGVTVRTPVAPRGEAVITLAYDSRGLGDWLYGFAQGRVAQVKDFTLVMRTDFHAIDFPPGTVSPTGRARRPAGWELTWRFASLVTGQRIGMDLPDRLNPGPLAARITFFAPVSLLFFLTVLVILGVLRDGSLHPVNYGFLSAAFFAFHLLLAYLVDHVQIHLAFTIASLVSVGLVTSYLRIVAGTRFALVRAGLAQLVFLVLFSYAFFIEGFTGLTVTVGAVATLFVLMQATARVDWGDVFARPAGAAR
jgi:hypothetical protein